MDAATDDLVREVEERLKQDALNAVSASSGWVAHLVRRAYMEGVRDGFGQGVEAECRHAAAGHEGEGEQ